MRLTNGLLPRVDRLPPSRVNSVIFIRYFGASPIHLVRRRFIDSDSTSVDNFSFPAKHDRICRVGENEKQRVLAFEDPLRLVHTSCTRRQGFEPSVVAIILRLLSTSLRLILPASRLWVI